MSRLKIYTRRFITTLSGSRAWRLCLCGRRKATALILCPCCPCSHRATCFVSQSKKDSSRAKLEGVVQEFVTVLARYSNFFFDSLVVFFKFIPWSHFHLATWNLVGMSVMSSPTKKSQDVMHELIETESRPFWIEVFPVVLEIFKLGRMIPDRWVPPNSEGCD